MIVEIACMVLMEPEDCTQASTRAMRRVDLGADALAIELGAAIVRHVSECAGVTGQSIIHIIVTPAAK